MSVARPRAILQIAALTLLFAFATAGSAAAAALAGFSATTYASGFVSGVPAGLAFIGTTLYAVDPADGGLYRAATAGPMTRVATVGAAPTGLAAFGGALYATRATTNDVVRIDPVTAAVTVIATSSAFSGLRLQGIAADTRSGDLYLTTASGHVWSIQTLPVVQPPAFVYQVTGGAPAYGIAVAPDGSVYISVTGGPTPGIWQAKGVTPGPIGMSFRGARGVGAIVGYVFANNADGSVTKVVIPGAGTGSQTAAFAGGAPGDLAAIGADGCFYASQGPAIIRLANADGSCDLGRAAPPPPPPTLTLVNISRNAPLIGNGDQSFDATFANLANPGGVRVTFTVTRGATSAATVVTTSPAGTASFAYSATTPGTDVVTASAVVGPTTFTSNSVTVVWPRALDTAKPTIRYSVSGTPGVNFACPNLTLGTIGETEYCGWYVSPPTVSWTVTANGPTGIDWAQTRCTPFTLTVNSPITGTPVTCIAFNGDGVSTALKVVLQALITAPTITASATTPLGPYVATPTNQNVTVSFACATDPALGPAGISFCSAPVTVTAEGRMTVSGYVVDVAGTRRDASFGPFVIDRTPPVVTVASMKTGSGAPYTPGTPTVEDVVVTFACTDNLDPHPNCPLPVTVTAGPTVTVSASDWAGNSKTYTFGGINIDRIGPTVSATVTPAPDASGTNLLSATVTVTAADPSGVASITYSAAGAQPIAPTTVASSGNPTTFSVPIALNVAGTTTVAYTAKDALGNASATGTTTVKIVSTQPSTLAITSLPILRQGAVRVSATLLGPGGTPIAGRTVTFTAGTATGTGITDASGVATATLTLAPGLYVLNASFAGDASYTASMAEAPLLVQPKSDDKDGDDKGGKGGRNDNNGGSRATGPGQD